MNKSIFKKITTADQLNRMLSLNASFLGEHVGGARADDIRKVDGSDLPDLTYLLSSCRNGYVARNYFSYSDPDTTLKGIAVANGASDDIVAFTKPIFCQMQFIDDRTWLVRTTDGSLQFILDGQESESFVDVDVMSLQPNLSFYQLDFHSGERGLACVDAYLFKGGLFVPKCAEDFENWYKDKIIHYGSEGTLDNNAVSSLFSVRQEVLRSIFKTSSYHELKFA